jgi:GDPmannose 4,6-dehydratase
MISKGLLRSLELGDISTKRDWGHAYDYVTAMWLSLQAPKAHDYVIASGVTRKVSDILDIAFGRVNLNWKDYVVSNAKLIRASDPKNLVGDPSFARDYLGWAPSYSFEQLICELVDHELDQIG